MAVAYLVVAVISAAVAIFALQNNQPMSVRFLAWSLESVPLAGAILVALAAGLVVAAVPLSIANWRVRSRARALQRRLDAVEAVATAPRDPAVLTPRPPGPPLSRSA